jgi:hypothetical protein
MKRIVVFSLKFLKFEDLTAMFRKLYGLDWMPEVKDMSNYLDTWNLAMKDYTKPFHDYLGLIGLVSKENAGRSKKGN